MDKNKIMNLASKFLSQEKVNKLSKAFDATSDIMSMANNPQEALSKAGITKEDLSAIEKHLNNPMANFILSPFGIDTKQVRDAINQLKGNSLAEQSPVNELDDLEKALKSIK